MKLLITGDWHYRSQNPRARVDGFQNTLNAKLREVGEIAKKHQVDAIICPGDVFDSPSPAYSTLTALENVVLDMTGESWTGEPRTPLLAIPGNHDEFGHSLESLDRTAYGHLAGTDMIRNLHEAPWMDHFALVSGTGFSAETDKGVGDYVLSDVDPAYKKEPSLAVHIHVAHGMLLERSPGYELKHTLIQDVAKHPDCPDVLICGHEHIGFGVKRYPRKKGGELVAINPGALARLTAHPAEIERMPQVCLLEVYPGVPPTCTYCGAKISSETARSKGSSYAVQCGSCSRKDLMPYEYGPVELWDVGEPVIETTLIPLECARPGHEVLSRAHIEQAADREARMGEFLGLLANEGEAKFLDIQAMVEGIAKSEGLGKDVVDEALRRIAGAREALGGGAK